MAESRQHRPWVGRNYGQLKGKRIAFVGFSHWGNPADETPDFTQRVVEDWANVYESRPFAERIRMYAGGEDPRTFWNSVAFFNTLPTLVGTEDGRYDKGSPEQIALVPSRVLTIIEDLKPDRLFVMSRKAWKMWPNYTGSYRDGTLQVAEVGEFDCGTYAYTGGETVAFGLPHPQFSKSSEMTAVFEAAMSFNPRSDFG